MMGNRVWLVLAVLFLAVEARADEVWIQHSGSVIQRDPTYLHGSNYAQPNPWEAEADLANGTFRTFASGSGGLDQNAYAGVSFGSMTNISGREIVFQNGWLKANIEGAIEMLTSPGPGQVNSSQVTGALSVRHNGVYSAASARQIGAFAESLADSDGNTVVRHTHTFGPLLETNGASVVANNVFLDPFTGLGRADFELWMPAITLRPGDTFRWDFSLQTLMNTGPLGGFAEVDFLNTASLGLVLPEGFEGALSADGVNPAAFHWITVDAPPSPQPIPEPGTLALIATGLLVLVFGRRARRGPSPDPVRS